MSSQSLLLLVVAVTTMITEVVSITNQKVTTLQQILSSETDHQTLRRVLQSPLQRSSEESQTGIETLQMMMKNLPPTSRELQMILGDKKENVTKVSQDILDRIDSPKIEVPVEAPLTFDINMLPSESGDDDYDEIINVDLYEDVDLARHDLNSAFISGTDPFSLSLAPTSSLLVTAGELVFIKFILTNRAPTVTKFFLDSGVGGVVTDNGVRGNGVERQTEVRQRMVFPGEISVVQTLQPEMILLNTNQSEEIRLGVTIPSTSLPLTRHLIHLTARPAVITEQLQPLTLQFYLVAREDPAPPPSPPSCLVSSETYLQSCPPHLLSALSCRTSLWQAAISFTAPAGVEAVRLSPEGGHWTRDNFVLGSQLEHQLVWTGDCCTHSVTLHLEDIRGHFGQCGAGIQERLVMETGQHSVMISVIVVITLALLAVIISASCLIVFIRRKRKAQLENMRNLPN